MLVDPMAHSKEHVVEALGARLRIATLFFCMLQSFPGHCKTPMHGQDTSPLELNVVQNLVNAAMCVPAKSSQRFKRRVAVTV